MCVFCFALEPIDYGLRLLLCLGCPSMEVFFAPVVFFLCSGSCLIKASVVSLASFQPSGSLFAHIAKRVGWCSSVRGPGGSAGEWPGFNLSSAGVFCLCRVVVSCGAGLGVLCSFEGRLMLGHQPRGGVVWTPLPKTCLNSTLGGPTADPIKVTKLRWVFCRIYYTTRV